ncbi:YihY/virulence factor BrkB family protein [Rhizobium leguminosarum]|uniref:YihY/virulence factor BrkB family protein n=1 Tax=Rhizobium leguminosarum TaxID=384 RepID=A0AAJ1AB78_RHILE|nr:YihY/virulence factor BrkB family protein [Rhizobium leguminosarum]MBY3173854.1 YihY/virulence factor BrkB family protein [Rhizobium leguminosarum]MBY5410960.1 YihY/virulence factor BrkB family protein [Rhizobium leguminosarum]MBY5517911.1 YihY/virulence factor BrkB family protein [Rhizobium leguminosarum]MBY5533881.1 YihY/virulence factor BrkB family protein [Rhizobium leguminosarum]MBY5540773.1 YihY/virulence factor BrkB family protein [Rhizobium leguminosarum]
MRDVVQRKRFSTAAAMMAAAIGALVYMQAVERRSAAPSADTGHAGDDHGRSASTPEAIPFSGLRDVFWRVFHEILDDRVTLIAAGVTFYLLLAIFPALAALVALYGLVADPVTISEHLRELAVLLPPGAFDLLADQIKALVERRDGTLGLTFFVGLAVALWSTHNGTLAIFDAMNVAYEEKEKRSLVRLNLTGLCFTLCAIAFAIVMVALVGVMPVVLSYLWLDQFKEHMALLLRWPLLLLVVAVAVTMVYRFGPSREAAKVRWMTWGAVLTTVAWAAMSLGFSFYLENFANYNATYGTLGALIGFLIWIWLSVVILIVGGELNAELEHQTARDTTTGKPLPMGARGAYVADTLGEIRN